MNTTRLETVVEALAVLSPSRAHVDKLTPSLLAKAFCGELLPQDPNDESAEKLLERIRNARG